jgi:GT2 family glycosyltransferase
MQQSACREFHVGDNQDPDDPSLGFTRKIDYCSRHGMMVLTELFEQLGGYDSSREMDISPNADLCIRARKADYLVYCNPLSVIVRMDPDAMGCGIEPSGEAALASRSPGDATRSGNRR